MERTKVDRLSSKIGQTVSVSGFLEAVRDQKRMQFLIIRDVSGVVQVVHEKNNVDSALAARISELTLGSAVTVIGDVIQNAQAKTAGIEIKAKEIKVAGQAATPLPIEPASSLELQMDWRFLSLRFPHNALVINVQTVMEQAMREFWAKHSFLEIHSPKLMAAASESGAELFRLPYFDTSACLAQSPQFYKQMAMAAGLDRVFEIGPVFRANPSFTSRHDTEFTSVDMEMSWIDSHEDVMALEEKWLQFVIMRIKETLGEEIKKVIGIDIVVPELPFPRITLAKAREILSAQGHEIHHKADLDPEGERRLARHIAETLGHEFVFVTHYPVDVRPFYHMRDESDSELTKSFDLLWKGLEITTGAQREHRHDLLVAQAQEKGFDLGPLSGYFSFFRFGCPPHGGMGIGLTRLLMIILERSNVREVTYLYRGPKRLTP